MKYFKSINSTVILFFLALLFIAGIFSQYMRINDHKENDHWVYYRTSKRIEAKQPELIYSFNDGAYPFQYAPPTLVIFSWMSKFTEKHSRQIWLIVQSIFLIASYPFLKKSLELFYKEYVPHSLLMAFILFYRYFLDSLYCGQVSGILFFLFSSGIYYSLIKSKTISNFLFLMLAFLKIIPGILIALNLIRSHNRSMFIRQFAYLCLTMLFVIIVFYFWFLVVFGYDYNYQFYSMLKSWFKICSAGQQYFDGSTIKSQSLRAVYLRIFGISHSVQVLWELSISIILTFQFYFWYKTRHFGLKSIYLSILLGIIVFIIVMPETLPYQIFNLMIPTLFICIQYLNSQSSLKSKILLGSIFCFCTIPTADLTGHFVSNTIQYYSLPFIVFIYFFTILVSEIYHQKKDVKYREIT